ncbi:MULTISPECIES: hypothetical protein [unclassified Mycobacterium]|uniref:hypothetical protein n=1 Tax=unclassified Mycobacterium TaxID=2642494 RepID=UPI0007FE171E|nr:MULTISPECIES: hypothetical protein [unclassified Mycobacterium]OBG71321.1 hypothetical protein A5700_12155 [Mycobacterium sp. E1214]OBH28689.1 hypothetical protein A5693_21470 [Mycobacterium sp. E1319]
MTDTTEIVVRVPGYAQAQLDRGDSLHTIPGFHRIVDTRHMQLVGRASDNRLHVIDEDGRLIQMDEAFYAAFATPVPVTHVHPDGRDLLDEPQADDAPELEQVEETIGEGPYDHPQFIPTQSENAPEVAEAKPARRRKGDKAPDAEQPAEETPA